MKRIEDSRFGLYADKATLDRIVQYDSVGEMWASCAKEFAQLNAVQDGDTATYAKLDEDMAYFRGALTAQGVGKGDKVGVFLPNSYDFVKVSLAVMTMGAVAVLLPPHLPAEALFGCSLKFGLKALVYDETAGDRLALIQQRNPAVKLVEAKTVAETKADLALCAPEDPCAVVFTGGTTGKSKGALLSHGAVMTGVRNGCYGYSDVFNLRYFLVLPLTHVFGLIRNFLTCMYTGGTLYICRNPKNMFREMAAYRPHILILVPALAELALNISRQFGRQMLGDRLKYIICGASVVPRYLVRAYADLGVALFPGYGLTETANLVSGNPESLKKPDSVGLPYAGQELKVVDGELWLKGDNLMTEYVGDPEENAAAFTDGYFRTGDLVRFDEDGYLYIVGRTKDIIVLHSGEKVSPAELEDKFCTLDLVQDALVYLTEENSDSLTLEVFPRAAVAAQLEGVTAEQALREQVEAINQTLPAFMRVSKLVVRDQDFERTPAMKKIRKK